MKRKYMGKVKHMLNGVMMEHGQDYEVSAEQYERNKHMFGEADVVEEAEDECQNCGGAGCQDCAEDKVGVDLDVKEDAEMDADAGDADAKVNELKKLEDIKVKADEAKVNKKDKK